MRDPDEPVQSHQPGHALATDMDTEPEPQLREHPRSAVSLTGVGVNAPDRGRQHRIRDGSRRGRSADPVVVAGGRDLQEPAGHRDGDPVGGELLDQPEPYFGSTFSRAKYAEVNSTRQRNSAWSLSAGVSKSRVFRGLEFSRVATTSRSAWVRSLMLTPLGKY